MKLHLPKLLRVAVVAAAFMFPQYVQATTPQAGDVLTAADFKDGCLEVGNPVTIPDSQSQNPQIVTFEGDLIVGNDMKVGTFYDSGEIVWNPHIDENLNGFGGKNATGNSRTNSLYVTGKVEIKDNGQVLLGGQTHKNNYMGLYAKDVVVTGTLSSKDSPNLSATMAYIDNLTINSGVVQLRTNDDVATGGYSGYENGDGSKQTIIRSSLIVGEGGTLLMGKQNGQKSDNYSSHVLNALGSSKAYDVEQGKWVNSASPLTITQTGGMIKIYGKTKIYKGLTVNQTGGEMVLANEAAGRAMAVFDGGVNTFTQGGDSNTILTIGEMSAGYSGSLSAQVNFIQTGSGTINLCKGTKFKSSSGASVISQSGGGTVNLTGDFSSAVFNVNLMKGTLSLTSSSTKLKSNEVTIASGTTLDNNGVFTVGTGSAGDAGVLNVTTGGTLNLVLDGTKAALITSADTITGWSMAEGSTLGIGFTAEYLDSLAPTGTEDVKMYDFSQGVLVAQDTNGAVDLSELKYTLQGVNASNWTWTGASLEEDSTGNIMLTGTLTFNPWVEVHEDNDHLQYEDDEISGRETGIVIKETVTLTGDNEHSLGTRIEGAEVTVGHADALGGGAVFSSGTSSLRTAAKVVANLAAPIEVESGTLAMAGKYKYTGTPGTSGEEQAEAWFCVDGIEGQDGFYRAASAAALQVVEIKENAKLDIDALDDVVISIGDTEYQLYSDGLAGEKLDYATYHMNTGGHDVAAGEILAASGVDTVVAMATTAGTLTVDKDIKVAAKGGSIVLESGKVVSGSIADASVDGSGGTIDADLSGDVTMKGSATISGKGTTAGNLKLSDATVTLGGATALGTATVINAGTGTLVTAENVKVGIGSTIVNESGKLTLDGTFDVAGLGDTPVTETHLDVNNAEGDNGFARDPGFTVQLVENSAQNAAKLEAGDNLVLAKGTRTDGVLDEESGEVTFGAGINHATYTIANESGSVSVSRIQDVAAGRARKVIMEASAGTLTADASIEVDAKGGALVARNAGTIVTGSLLNSEITAEGGEIAAGIAASTLMTKAGAMVSGDVTDTEITAAGGEISGSIQAGSSVRVTGDTTLSGANSYSGGTVIDGAELKLTAGSGVGSGAVELVNHGTFDMGGNALTNYIKVTGCTLRNAGAYDGDMDVYSELKLEGSTTAGKVMLIGGGAITGDKLTTDSLEVQTTDDASVAGDLSINDNGTVTLNDGKVLVVGGSLTLGQGVALVLNGDYAVGDKLVTGSTGLEAGEVTLTYADTTVELEQVGNSLVLVSRFKQGKAETAVQGNWGIAAASHAFVDAVRGQHSNTGCIADGCGTVWAAAFGSYSDLDGADIDVRGAAVGVDARVGSRSTVGIALGYTDGEVTPTGQADVDQEGTYVALYGEHGLAKLSPVSCLSLDWVAAYGNTESDWNGTDWEQDSVQLNTRLNWNRKVTDRLCMSVFGGLEYLATESDTVNGVKTGSIQNLRGEVGVGARYVAWGTPGTAAAFDEKGSMVSDSRPGCEKLVLHGEVRYMNDLVRSNPVVRMNGLSGYGENPGRQGIGLEAGATYRISDRWSASANYGYNAMEDSREHRVNVGASYTF